MGGTNVVEHAWHVVYKWDNLLTLHYGYYRNLLNGEQFYFRAQQDIRRGYDWHLEYLLMHFCNVAVPLTMKTSQRRGACSDPLWETYPECTTGSRFFVLRNNRTENVGFWFV